MSTAVLGTHVAPASPRLRLTPRGRMLLFLLVALPVVVAAVALVLGGGGAVATGEEGADSFQYVTVEAGQTLWQLATELAPSADPREVVSDIAHLNQLPSSDVHPGQRLAIPVQYGD
ncbi:hypothetical protein BH09ACT3_BH09ACT3_16160 [soil metagenome]